MDFIRSSIGRKFVMAITGIGLVLFVIVHLIGNLSMFAGAEAINSYAELLKSSQIVLWSARIGLLALIVGHVAAAISLKRENGRSTPSGLYEREHHSGAAFLADDDVFRNRYSYLYYFSSSSFYHHDY